MKLTMLGTGNAMVTECYNTCFTLEQEGAFFLVDAGGGNGILKRLSEAGIDWRKVRDIFVTHKHMDHILGILWIIRIFCQNMVRGKLEGEVRIYGHGEVIQILDTMSRMLLWQPQAEYIGKRIRLIPVEDGQTISVLGRPVTFFDIHSDKAKQFGFTMEYEEGKRLTCCGDEPYNEQNEKYVRGSHWLLHEAFCLSTQADRFHPYEKHHSTVKDACMVGESFQIPNLLLYHTEDKNIQNRKELYLKEGKNSYHGNLLVPNDGEVVEL